MPEPSFLQRLKERKLVQWAEVFPPLRITRGAIETKRLTIAGLILTVVAACQPQVEVQQVKLTVNPQDGQRYVWIPPGSFQMGCSSDDGVCQDAALAVELEFTNEKPSHRVTISRGFWMGQTEVTIGAYRKYAEVTGEKVPEELVLAAPERFRSPDFPPGDDYPLAFVTPDEAVQYCEWAGGRLPTEAEWEYAARAGSTTERYGNVDEIAWYANNSGRTELDSDELWETVSSNNEYLQRVRDNGNDAHPVGKKAPNDFGLYDILGNVWEHCADWYGEKYYQESEEENPKGPPSGEFRVMRGADFRGPTWGVRVSIRRWMLPDHRFGNIGFRCVQEVIP